MAVLEVKTSDQIRLVALAMGAFTQYKDDYEWVEHGRQAKNAPFPLRSCQLHGS